jgi:hypothetical protein
MTQTCKSGALLVLGGLLVAGAFLLSGRPEATARAADDKAATSGPRYTVVETEGHNLLVTDNGTNTLYYYTIDRDKEIGSDLKLRGSVALDQVGKPVIKITKAP